MLAVPLLREGSPSELILIRRTEVRPFTDKQIALLKTFATRRHRNRERAAVQGIAGAQRRIARGAGASDGNAEVLGIISRSPTDVQPVLDAIVESAAGFVGSMMWCCDSAMAILWFCGLILVPYLFRVEISIDEPQFRWMREHGTLHIPEPRAERFPDSSVPGSWHAPF